MKFIGKLISLLIIILILTFYAVRSIAVSLKAEEGNVQVAIGADADPALFSTDVVDILARHGVEVFLEIHSSEIAKSGSAPEEITRSLNGRGVKVWAWLLLDTPNGPYASDAAAADYYGFWQRFQKWASDRGLFFIGIALDFEPDKRTLRELLGGGPLPNLSTLLENMRPALHEKAAQTYQKLFKESRAAGYRNYAVVYMTALDDQEDGDDDLQLMFRAPGVLASNVGDFSIDVLSTMLYRPNAERMGMASSPYFIYSYARSMKEYFPERGTVVLKAWPDRADDPGCEKLIGDMMLLKAMGFGRVEIYSLQIILEEYGHDVLERIFSAVNGTGRFRFGKDPATVILRDSFKRIDGQLDEK